MKDGFAEVGDQPLVGFAVDGWGVDLDFQPFPIERQGTTRRSGLNPNFKRHAMWPGLEL